MAEENKKADKGQGDFVKSVRAAFSSWWTVLGIVAASVSGFNLLRHALKIDLAKVMAEIVRAYQALVHFPVLWVFEWLHWPKPPEWAIEVGLLWVLVGGVVLRSAWALRVSARRSRSVRSDFTAWDELIGKSLPQGFITLCLLAWPLVIGFLLANPFAHSVHYKTWMLEPSLRMAKLRLDNGAAHKEEEYMFLYDMRVVLATQAFVALGCITVWVVLNALLKPYGE